MRYLLVPLLLITLCSAAAAQQPVKDYASMPVAEWLGLSYRRQLGSARDLASRKNLEMCRKQASELVECMRTTGTEPVWKDSTMEKLLLECSFDIGVTPAATCPNEAK